MSSRSLRPTVMVTSPVGAPSVIVTVLPSTMCRVTWAATSTIPVAMQVGCAGLGGALGVPCSVSPLFCPLSPAVSSPLCCQQHSEEVCESCVVKTTLTAENAVEANKLSNNYKVGSHRAGWGGISWIPSGFSHLKISLSTVWLQEMEEPHYSTAMGRPLRDCQRALL